MLQSSGSSSRLFGRSTSPRRSGFLARNLTFHQADLLFIPHDKLPRGHKVFRYALTVVDVASRYKEAEPLASKNSDEVAKAFQTIYKRSPLTWPQMLQVDPGREFMGAVTKEMEKHKTYIRRGRAEIHRDQAIVERFNLTLAERLFRHQYAVEMRLPEGQRSTAWVERLPKVVSALNNEVTSLIGMKPAVAIKERAVHARPSTPYFRPVGEREKLLPSLVQVRYLYQPGELEGGKKRATDPIWSLDVYSIERSFTKPEQPVLYYLRDGPKHDKFAISTSLASLKVVKKGPPTRFGLWMFTALKDLLPNQSSPFSTICATVPSTVLLMCGSYTKYTNSGQYT